MHLTEYCENCGKNARLLTVVDGVLTCNKCVANQNERFWNAMLSIPSSTHNKKEK